MTYSATYSPEDNKLRLSAAGRLPRDLYDRVRAHGFAWAPKQEIFVAGMWTPEREDLLLELCGEIDDEDSTLDERAAARAERFDGYSENRMEDANRAAAAVARITDHIPLGQPILIGHHSEAHARRDAKRIDNGQRRAVEMWKTAKYWEDRAASSIRHARYLGRPDVRARRIKTIEADKRGCEKRRAEALKGLADWSADGLTLERAKAIANYDHISRCLPLSEYPRTPPASQYEGQMGLWSALEDGVITPEQARDIAIPTHRRIIANNERWIAHNENRLTYERAMLKEAGGTVADKNGPEQGGACRYWSQTHWSYIQKVNKTTVSALENWGNGGRDFRRLVPFDKLQGIMSAAQVAEARAAGRIVERADRTGFFLRDTPGDVAPTPAAVSDAPAPGFDFERMRETLRNGGVKVVAVPQLFPTPTPLAARMVELADIRPAHTVLEPNGGTGQLVRAIIEQVDPAEILLAVVEINPALTETLAAIHRNVIVKCADFLQCDEETGTYDRIVMNPPFQNGDDIRHIEHAYSLLRPGGRLVALCANGPRQRAKLQPLALEWEDLPPGTFKDAGTGVNTALLVMERP